MHNAREPHGLLTICPLYGLCTLKFRSKSTAIISPLRKAGHAAFTRPNLCLCRGQRLIRRCIKDSVRLSSLTSRLWIRVKQRRESRLRHHTPGRVSGEKCDPTLEIARVQRRRAHGHCFNYAESPLLRGRRALARSAPHSLRPAHHLRCPPARPPTPLPA